MITVDPETRYYKLPDGDPAWAGAVPDIMVIEAMLASNPELYADWLKIQHHYEPRLLAKLFPSSSTSLRTKILANMVQDRETDMRRYMDLVRRTHPGCSGDPVEVLYGDTYERDRCEIEVMRETAQLLARAA